MYSPQRAYVEFTAFLNEYERDHATDEEEDMLFPIYVPDSMRRRMIIILSDPHYSTMMFESIRGVDREIKFMGSAYVDVEGSLDGDDEDVSVYGIGTNGDDDCASSVVDGGSDDSGVVHLESGSDGVLCGLDGNITVGVDVKENNTVEEELEDLVVNNTVSVVDAVNENFVDGCKVGCIGEDGLSGVIYENEGMDLRSKCMKRCLSVSSDEEDVCANMYLREDCMPKDELTWEKMFDAVENLNLEKVVDSDDEEMSEISVATDDGEFVDGAY